MGLAIIGEPTPLGGYFAQHFAEVVGRRPQRIRQKIAFICPALAFPSVTYGAYWQKYVSVSRNDGIA